MTVSGFSTSDPYLDYDLISLSNTLQHSFQEGIELAATILNAPVIMTNLYGQVTALSESSSIVDPDWVACVKTYCCNETLMQKNPHIFSAAAPAFHGKIYCYNTETSVTKRQLQLAPYVAWMLFMANNGPALPSRYLNSQSSRFFGLLLNGRIEKHALQNPRFGITLPKTMQIAAVESRPETNLEQLICAMQLLFRTELVSLYKEKYVVLLIAALSQERMQDIRGAMNESEKRICIGLSYSFRDLSDVHPYLLQAIVATKELRKRGSNERLAEYATCLPYDLFFSYTSDRALSTFLHPLLRRLSELDRQKNTQYLETLRIYVEQGGDVARVAKKMHLHRNSVLYRLKLIQENTRYDVNDPAYRTILRYAFALEEYLSATKRLP